MKFLTGFKPTGEIHLGNYLGAIKPALEIPDSGLFCVADYHALTTSEDPQELKYSTQKMCAALLSFTQNQENKIVYRQSKIPEVQELSWILSCLSPMGLMERGHAVKAASEKNLSINVGTFNYPILMAADILLFKIEYVPVGKDQHQHIQIAEILANKLNHRAQSNLLTVPKALITEQVGLIPGLDGNKMSKSYNNTISFFLSESHLKKKISEIKTDSTPMSEPMNYDTCNVFKLFQHFGTSEEISQIKLNYQLATYGYGHAKKDLLEVILRTTKKYQEEYENLKSDWQELNLRLEMNEAKIRIIAQKTIQQVKNAVGL